MNQTNQTIVGIDFDNTLVCYDRLFHCLALERGLIPDMIPPNKQAVRDYLRRIDREDDWTEMQGEVYGPRIREAEAFPGIAAFFERCHERRFVPCIISHKTRYPYRGPRYDLIEWACEWLKVQGWIDAANTGLTWDRVFFEASKQEKLQRIAQCRCSCFIDDLPEFLMEDDFPSGVRRILFDPNQQHDDDPRYRRVASWCDMMHAIEKECRHGT